MRVLKSAFLCAGALVPVAAHAENASADAEQRVIVVTGAREETTTATKTDTPILETPQPITVIDDELFLAQGAVSVGDTLNYVSGVTANPYGPDSRVDGAFVRGINALQFRDGMRDIFSFYASIRADPYNFDQVELGLGPVWTGRARRDRQPRVEATRIRIRGRDFNAIRVVRSQGSAGRPHRASG
jgi:iron complex outermembrane receptor protein